MTNDKRPAHANTTVPCPRVVRATSFVCLAALCVGLVVGCSSGGSERDGVGSAPGDIPAPAGPPIVAPPKPAGSASPQFGFLPTTITATDAVAAYDQWKTAYLESCPDSVFRVRSDEPELTVSEGIAYGMLLAAYHGDQTTFDGLWQYYLDNRDSKGLMHWRRSGCEGGASGDNAASDADIDAALALIKASCQWPNTGRHDYADDASTLLRTIQRVELSLAPGGGYYLKPGDSFGGADCINYSYFAPGYYRIFADYMSDSAAVWGSMPAVAYALINAGANAQTGLVPNWAELDGSTPPMGCDWYENPEIYGWDAVRTPWRVGMDYLWTGDAQAGAYLQKLSGWVDSIGGIGEVYAEHTLDGASRVPYRSNPATGGMAFAGVAVDQATSDAYFLYLKNNPTSGYFHESLRALYLLAAAGMMSHDCTGVVYP